MIAFNFDYYYYLINCTHTLKLYNFSEKFQLVRTKLSEFEDCRSFQNKIKKDFSEIDFKYISCASVSKST